MNKKQPPIPLLILLTSVFLLLSGGIFLFYNCQKVNRVARDKQQIIYKSHASKPIIQQPQNQTAEWKSYYNENKGYEFEYPAIWTVDDSGSSNHAVILKEGNSDKMYLDIDAESSVMGITYCGTYPDDPRCENIMTAEGLLISIDWGAGYATVSVQDSSSVSGYLYNFSLNKINAETKQIFRHILSSFKFIQ